MVGDGFLLLDFGRNGGNGGTGHTLEFWREHLRRIWTSWIVTDWVWDYQHALWNVSGFNYGVVASRTRLCTARARIETTPVLLRALWNGVRVVLVHNK